MTLRWAEFVRGSDEPGQPDPPLRNPYMEGIEAIEGILYRMGHFATEFPKSLDKAKKDEYAVNLLEVRDTLHRFRQAEMDQQGRTGYVGRD